jgi:hypothetical protein
LPTFCRLFHRLDSGQTHLAISLRLPCLTGKGVWQVGSYFSPSPPPPPRPLGLKLNPFSAAATGLFSRWPSAAGSLNHSCSAYRAVARPHG